MDVNEKQTADFSGSQTLNPQIPDNLKASGTSLTPAQALDLAFQEYSPNTRRAYSRAFQRLQQWAEIQELKDLESFDTLKLLAYKQKMRDEGRKPATINLHLSAVRKICAVLHEVGFLKKNPFETTLIRAERVAEGSQKGSLSLAQLHAMIDANERIKYDTRNRNLLKTRNALLLKFLYLTAARRSEAANLKWEDLQQDGEFQVVILQQTKSGEPQKLKLRRELFEELECWNETLKTNQIECEWVFPSLSFRTLGGKMSGKGVNDVVSKLGSAIGLKISAHYLRHTAITLALELGEPLQKVQSYARHASANTTIRYFHDQQFLEKNPTDRLPMI